MDLVAKFLGFITNFFIDKKHSPSKKFGWAILIFTLLGSIVYADYRIGFTQRIHTINKIDDITKIESLKLKIRNNDALLTYLDSIEISILKERHIYYVFESGTTEVINPIKNSNKNAVVSDKINATFNIWHLLASSFLWLLVLAIVPFLLLFSKQKTKDSSMIVGVVTAMFLLGGISWAYYYFLGLIPVINGQPWINYLIDIFAQGATIAIFYFSQRKKKVQ